MRSILTALTLLTRIPIRIRGELREDQLPPAVAWFPLVGAIVGWLAGAAEHMTRMIAGSLASPALALLTSILVTGGLHLDGAADSVDGLAAGKGPEETLAIMKDSRVGAFGAMTVSLDLLMRFAFLAAVDPARRWLALVGSAALGRAAMVWAISRCPSARRGRGLGAILARRTKQSDVRLAVGLAALVTVVLCLLGGWRALASLLLSVLVGVFVTRGLNRRLSGLTGDTYGFINEAVEITAIFGWAVKWSP